MREKFKRFCDTANPDLLRLVIIFVLVGLLLAGFLLFGRSGNENSVMPAWEQAEHVEPPDERLAAAQKENPDTVAWITIPGTNIDAPVQQYGDNDYYLRRDENGSEDYHGCIYADYACRMDSSVKVSRNLIFTGIRLPTKIIPAGLRICTNTACSSSGRKTRTFMFRWQMKSWRTRFSVCGLRCKR